MEKKNLLKNNRLSTFGIALIVYVIILAVVASVILYKLWNSLSSFQINYEKAQEAANPDLVIDDYMSLFEANNISELVDDEWDNISPYETQKNIDKFIEEHVSDGDIRWERRSDFSDLKPKYDVYSKDKYIGAIALKQKTEVDEYGFHKCELDHAEVGFAPEELKSITIKAYDGVSIYVNDVLMTDKRVCFKALENQMDVEASEETETEYIINTYELTGFFEYPEVRIEKQGFVCDMNEGEDADGKYEYTQLTMYNPEMLEEISKRALEIAKAYDMYAAGRREIGGMGAYFTYSGRGYKMLSGLAFDISIAGSTTVYDILTEKTGNLLMYSPEDAVIDTYQSIYRVHRNIEYNEDINIRWYLKKINGRWMVKDFSMRI